VTAVPTAGTQDAASPTALANAVADVADIAAQVGRTEVADRLRAAAARTARATTIVCVVGEFKQGKSSLVNALVGADVCPVDDDLATATITLLTYAEQPSARIRRRDGERTVVEPIPLDALREVVTEAGNPGNERRIERAEIFVPAPLLKDGVAIVDTPGMGGLGAGQAAATLAFLPYADALIFVSDATSELTGPELDFLGTARERCPVILFAMTKVDVAPAWRRISDRNRVHLAGRGLDLEALPVSSTLHEVARTVASADLARQSGISVLLDHLRAGVTEPARAMAARRAADEGRAAIDQLIAALRAELGVLEDPAGLEKMLRSVEEARARLEHLRGPGARWSTILSDRVSDLSNETTHELRAALRGIGREYDERVDALKTPADWTELGRSLATDVSETVADVFATLATRSRAIRREVADVLRAESLEIGEESAARSDIDVAALWRAPRIDDEGSRARQALGGALTGLRGAQGGIMLLGLVGSILPAAVGALVLSAPITLGLGVAFAGSQLMDANKRKLAQRRQKAKAAVRAFVDDVQFQVSNELSDELRATQRDLRDVFTARVAELTQALTETARRAQEDAAREETGRRERTRENSALISRLETLGGRLVTEAS
jgi:hypothetical protein